MKNILDKVVEKIKARILRPVTFSRKSFRLWDNVEKYGIARQATNGKIIRRMRFACWMTKATHTLRICNTAFPHQRWFHESASLPRLFVYCLSCFNDTDIVRMHTWRVVCVSFKHFTSVFCTSSVMVCEKDCPLQLSDYEVTCWRW